MKATDSGGETHAVPAGRRQIVGIITTVPGAGLMNTVISYASGKPSQPLRGYSYVHDSNLRQPREIAATMHKMLCGYNSDNVID